MQLKPGAALLFDIDGTLADTDPLHLQAFNRTFEPFGHHFDKDRFALELQGKSNDAIAARLVPHLPPERRAEIMREKEALFRDLAQTSIHAVPGLFDLLDMADGWDLPMAAVTNAPRENAELILGSLGIRSRFRVLVIGDELAHGKPHPLPYLEGLRLLGADAAASVAFEDSRTGIKSATTAGLATIGMRTALNAADMLAAGAVLSADGYDDPAVIALIKAKTTAQLS